jgi:Rieske Fe-S protein
VGPGDDQERFEDYLELEQFIEGLQAGRVAHPPKDLTAEQARIYRMAALFRSASPEEAAPRAEFVADLQARLDQELQQPPRRRFPFTRQSHKQPPRPLRVSRRALLAGGAAAAAAMAASVAIGAGVDHAAEEKKIAALQHQLASWPPLVPPDVPTVWHPVTTLAELGNNVIRFETTTAVGYLIRNDGDDHSEVGNPKSSPVVAVSAACTHMGCIVQWNKGDNKFHCPCHGGVFTEYGEIDNTSAQIPYFSPLPRYEVMIDPDGTIRVRIPAPSLAANVTTM